MRCGSDHRDEHVRTGYSSRSLSPRPRFEIFALREVGEGAGPEHPAVQRVERAQRLARAESICLGMGATVFRPETREPTINTLVLVEPDGEIAWRFLKATRVPGSGNLEGDGVLPRLDTAISPDAVMVVNLPVRGVTTIYSRIGDTFSWLCTAAFFGLLFALKRRRAGEPSE